MNVKIIKLSFFKSSDILTEQYFSNEFHFFLCFKTIERSILDLCYANITHHYIIFLHEGKTTKPQQRNRITKSARSSRDVVLIPRKGLKSTLRLVRLSGSSAKLTAGQFRYKIESQPSRGTVEESLQVESP